MRHREIFYTPPENVTEERLRIEGEELVHLTRAVRKKVRDVIEVVDGQGNCYTAVLTQITTRGAEAEIQKRSRFLGEPNFHLTLAQAVPKGSRFDWVIEKGTELGVAVFIPLLCQHSVIEPAGNRQHRWKKIAIAAMKQSARSVLPEIRSPQPFHDVVRSTGMMQQGFIAESGAGAKGLTQLVQELRARSIPLQSAIVLIGPEGGFSNEELNFARENGYLRFSLGPRRLRTETAGLVASAILMELAGELS
ncbi:MAG: 16S rRNA (uracil(1498)-N(3))-methyltransferase [candidate division KSB1 bacterium]|nr:16S rRNA (uracil(1498)-N(3))-methyltransferase [candidate division KSB1 bacterium]MDZ7335969.1 16S rRNA (uracil(1498)-N(3))-methyltransferase [candidate division KSB1 bacterium]MDZ7357935.1 16S rRNA (uracil(1498)-N(3))-methyltransferase [candidate division KSB1 bacterium]MDZ7376264.1 16S rRNA (uracil(1498)-N(3))-methyltransferase [candidate division KSB1 bacterium]MDZ7402190.1 16S rRNA (uracil(1498)-N(3))-methyltransferase [candidate division KSB1 bacterium]